MNLSPDNIPAADLTLLLKKHMSEMGPVTSLDLNAANVTRLDFSAANPLLTLENLQNTQTFTEVVNRMLREKAAEVGVGGYLEHRVIYRRSGLFNELSEARSLHLGIDIWAPAGTTVFSPLPAVVHSFQDNANFGDYGPTIILQHQLDGISFYTLYGHLNRASLQNLETGKVIAKSEKIAEFGPYPENGDWPPHLHFQVMADLQGLSGDYAGVCKPSEKEIFAAICPNPNLILQSRHLT
ncbi:peptidoglycan DD-metalloendopeptidase family protein [Adhaeribacter soli]|nr:peptidoglycan DD-metalloendopeptidase family protein [Adhaeribacter soli]